MKQICRFLSLFITLSSVSAVKAAVPAITSSLGSQTYWVNENFDYTITATESPVLFLAGGYQAVGGLTLDSATGAITGAPLNAGEFELAIAAENAAAERSVVAEIDIVVVPTAITSSLAPSDGVVGEEYSYLITTDSSESVTYSDSGSLPPGLTRVDNIISGKPTLAGTYPVFLAASDVNGNGVVEVTFTITDPVPVITSSLQEEVLLGDEFNYTITATNSPVFYTGDTTSVSGLSSVNPTTGVFSGTPVSAGNYSIDLQARNAAGDFNQPTTLNLVVHPELITSSSIASAVVDSPFVFEITTVNDQGFAHSNDDDLPPGLTRVDNIISGTPTLPGTYEVDISAATLENYDNEVLTITVTYPAPEITSSLVDQNILAGVPYAGYTITGTYSPTGYSATGLDAVGGLVLDAVSGVISGTPLNSGSFPITIAAENVPAGFGDPATFNLNVSPTIITSPSNTSGVVGTSLTYEITTAGTNPIAYGVAGSLPPGLSRSGTTISGIPTQAGTYTVMLSASNLDGKGSLPVTFTITDPAPAIYSSLAAQTIVVNEPFSYTITATNNPTGFSAIGLNLIGGLDLDTSTGVISGTPLNEGEWVIQIGAENAAGTSPLEFLNLEVKAAQYFLEGEVGVPFSHKVTTSLTNASIVVSGLSQIPDLSFDSTTEIISGTPTKFGIYTITVTAIDEEGIIDTYDTTVTVKKTGGSAPTPVITSSTSIFQYEGEDIYYQIQADGNPDSFAVFGLGPLGLTLDSSTGEITGIPTLTGDFYLSVRATNSAGTGSEILQLTVVPETQPIVRIISPFVGFTAQVGVPFEVRVSASNSRIIESVLLIDENFNQEDIPAVGEPGDDNYQAPQPGAGAAIESTVSFGSDQDNNGTIEFGDLMQVSSTPGEYVFTATLDEFDEIELVAVALDRWDNQVRSLPVRFTVIPNGAPTAVITSPINGGNSPYKLGDIIAIDITASDSDGSVSSVEVYNGSTSIGTATRTSNTTFRLNYTANAVGSVNLQVRVTDDSGNTSVSATETITVVTGDIPVITIDESNSVSDGDSITAGDNVTILVNATDADGFVTQVQILGNGEVLGQANPTGVAGQLRYNLATDIEDVGIITLEARATDDRGNVGSSSVVNLNVTPGSVPEVSIIAPTVGASQVVNQPFEIRVSATDNDGFIAGVRLSDIRFARQPPTTNSNGVTTPGAVIESTRSFNGELMQPSSNAGEFVYFATITNPDIVDLEATAFDNSGNEVSTVVQFFVTDGTPPIVSIDSPTAGSIISRGSFAPIEITASDADGTVQQVEVFNGAISLGFATPLGGLNKYRLDYNATSPGQVYLQARATDDRGNVAISNIEIFTVETGATPTLSITTPESDDVVFAGDSVEILVNATDSDGFITQVSVYDGETLLGEAFATGVSSQYRYNLSTDGSDLGTLNLEARAVDNDGNSTASTVVNLVVTPGTIPVVSIISPTAGDTVPVGGLFEIRVSATDVDGSITSVVLYDTNYQTTNSVVGTATVSGLRGNWYSNDQVNTIPGVSRFRSFYDNVMQPSSVSGEYVFTTTLANPDVVDLVATAYDNAGNAVASLPVQFTASAGALPDVTVTIPSSVNSTYTIGDTIPIDITAVDPDGSITGVEIYNGNTLLSQAFRNGDNTFTYYYELNTTGIVNIQARATDDSGNTSVSSTKEITVVPGSFPSVSITSPTGGIGSYTSGDNIPIQITATDTDGFIARVRVFNGASPLGDATPTGVAGQYQYNFTTRINEYGTLDIWAQATDELGNRGYSEIKMITVLASLPTVSAEVDFTTITVEETLDLSVRAANFGEQISRVTVITNGIILDEILPTSTPIDQATTAESTGQANREQRFAFNIPMNSQGVFPLTVEVEDQNGIIYTNTDLIIVVNAKEILSNQNDFLSEVGEIFLDLVGRPMTEAEEDELKNRIDGTLSSRINYISSLLSSNLFEEADEAALIYRTMTGKWPNGLQLRDATTTLFDSTPTTFTTNGTLVSQYFQDSVSVFVPIDFDAGDSVTATFTVDDSTAWTSLRVTDSNGSTLVSQNRNNPSVTTNFVVQSSGTYTFEFYERITLFPNNTYTVTINTVGADGTTNPKALVNDLLDEYALNFGAFEVNVDNIIQLFYNKHQINPTNLNLVRLYNEFSNSTDISDTIGKFALDNESSALFGANGNPLSSNFEYEAPNDATKDLEKLLVSSIFLDVAPTDQHIASYSGMTLEQAIEDILIEAYSPVPYSLYGASSLASNWYYSSWFGMFTESPDISDWVYSSRLGWVYVAPSGTPSGAWLYSSKLGAWLWSSSEMNGFYYQAGRNTWVYILPVGADSNGAWLNYTDTNQWQFVTP